MQIQNVVHTSSRIIPALVSLFVHCAMIGIVLIAGKLVTSHKLQEKQFDISKAFTLISPASYQCQPASIEHNASFHPTASHEIAKVEQSAIAKIDNTEPLAPSIESNSEKNNQNQVIDTALNNANAATGLQEKVGISAGIQEAGKPDPAGYINEKSISGGLRAVFKPAVPYPQVAQNREIEGDVEVAFIVSPQGAVENVSILRTPNPVFVSTVQKTVKSWRFKPAIVGGVPVRVKVVQNISFRLD